MDLTAWQQDVEFWFETHDYSGDASHDIAHFRRVWRTARQIAEGQPVDLLVILLASYFHDLVSLPKNHPRAPRSWRRSRRWLFSGVIFPISLLNAMTPSPMR